MLAESVSLPALSCARPPSDEGLSIWRSADQGAYDAIVTTSSPIIPVTGRVQAARRGSHDAVQRCSIALGLPKAPQEEDLL